MSTEVMKHTVDCTVGTVDYTSNYTVSSRYQYITVEASHYNYDLLILSCLP